MASPPPLTLAVGKVLTAADLEGVTASESDARLASSSSLAADLGIVTLRTMRDAEPEAGAGTPAPSLFPPM